MGTLISLNLLDSWIYIVCPRDSFSTVNNKVKIPPGAEELVGKAVEHLFEKEDGEKNEWRGMVLSRAPVMTNWYYITYEKDPVLYMYQLWDDYAEGDLRILPEAGIANLCLTEAFLCKTSLSCKQFKCERSIFHIGNHLSIFFFSFFFACTPCELKNRQIFIMSSCFTCRRTQAGWNISAMGVKMKPNI